MKTTFEYKFNIGDKFCTIEDGNILLHKVKRIECSITRQHINVYYYIDDTTTHYEEGEMLSVNKIQLYNKELDSTPITEGYLDSHYRQDTEIRMGDGSKWYHLWRNYHIIFNTKGGEVLAEDAPYIRLKTIGDIQQLESCLKGE